MNLRLKPEIRTLLKKMSKKCKFLQKLSLNVYLIKNRYLPPFYLNKDKTWAFIL